MRTIKFRAKALVNNKHSGIKAGDFVFGCYIESGCDAPCIIYGDGEQIEVDKATLGQLTGIVDNKGNDIYEGDRVKSLSKFHCGFDGVAVVTFVGGGFVATADGRNFHYHGINSPHSLIVGTAHDIPKLINNGK